MDEPLNEPEIQRELPQPIARRHRPSIVWLIPVVAALIGAWMAVRAYSETGPTITITFQSAEGIEAGQTHIKYKDVVIGKVKAVNLSRDLQQVVVTADLNKEASDLLSENSRFWVVRARIGTSGITGLGTLLSGAYIGMDPGKPGPPAKAFKGAESVPVLTPHMPGELVQLRAEKLGSLNIGSPVHYRQFRVGEVAGFDLEPGGQSVLITVLVHSPYNGLIHVNTRFWDAGGVDVSLDSSGLRMHSDSIVDMLLGGIAFETPRSLGASEPAHGDEVFTLYPSHDQIFEKVYLDRHYFVVNFSESVRGLTRGAPVEYRGIKVGQVEDFNLEFHATELEGRIPVLIALEPERFRIVGAKGASLEAALRNMVKKGLRAQLKTGSLVMGNLFIDLGFHPEDPARAMTRYGAYQELPTTPSSMGVMMANLARFSERLQKLPLEEVFAELRTTFPVMKDTLQRATVLIDRLDKETAPQAKATLAQAQATMATLEKTLHSESPTQGDLRTALEEFTKASRAIRDLADTLERHPESMIFGKGKKP